jgi:hypothetical protein
MEKGTSLGDGKTDVTDIARLRGLSIRHISLLTEVLTVINLAAIFHNTVQVFELSTEPNDNTIIV